jgi:hypothetical protein
MTTHFIPILNILIKKSSHQKIQEHAPSEWDVGLGKHLQCCLIFPPPTHHTLRLTCITPDATNCVALVLLMKLLQPPPSTPLLLPGK